MLRIKSFVAAFFACALAMASDSAPKRIVSIAPGFTEILYTLGLDQQIVGTTNYCDYPPQAKQTVKIGDVLNPNVEKIIALRPDIVFCGAWKWTVPEKLRSVGINVVEIKDAENVADIFDRFLQIGEKVGRKEQAGQIVSEMKSKLDAIRKRTVGLNPKPHVYVELDTGNWTTGGGSYINEILELAGLENIFRDRKESYLMVTLESIASRDPDLILSLNRTKDEYISSPAWQAFRAVREGKILDKNAMNWDTITRQSARLVDGVERLEQLCDEIVGAHSPPRRTPLQDPHANH